jgi:predicted nucleic acid-binding protein
MGIKTGETLFLDTNVLLTATDRSRTDHLAARRIFSISRRGGFHLALSGQVIREYLVVATRPMDANGLGLSVSDALRNAEEFRRRTVLLEESEAVSKRLGALVAASGVSGTRIHDANIVATMLTHGTTLLVTQNRGDFTRFPDVNPFDIKGSLSVLEETGL